MQSRDNDPYNHTQAPAGTPEQARQGPTETFGVIESSLSVFSELSQLRAATPFVIAIVVLLWLGQTQGRSDSARVRGFDR